jgi:peptide/nickel transport system ATP-binding protein
MIFVSHDLSVVRHMSDRVAVMYQGSVVEQAPAEEIYRRPRHEYTRSLIASIPARPAVSSP